MRQLPRPIYITWRVFQSFGQTGTRLFNAVVLGGSTRQSTSARVHVEQWPRARVWINNFFRLFGQEDHCRDSWEAEVHDALRTLEKNKMFEVKSCSQKPPKHTTRSR